MHAIYYKREKSVILYSFSKEELVNYHKDDSISYPGTLISHWQHFSPF